MLDLELRLKLDKVLGGDDHLISEVGLEPSKDEDWRPGLVAEGVGQQPDPVGQGREGLKVSDVVAHDEGMVRAERSDGHGPLAVLLQVTHSEGDRGQPEQRSAGRGAWPFSGIVRWRDGVVQLECQLSIDGNRQIFRELLLATTDDQRTLSHVGVTQKLDCKGRSAGPSNLLSSHLKQRKKKKEKERKKERKKEKWKTNSTSNDDVLFG